jgi:hypothetical protein
MAHLHELKEHQKDSANRIKKTKLEIKETQRKGQYAGILQANVLSLIAVYRLNHIAYSLLKGRTYSEIENPTERKKLSDEDWKYINTLQETYREENVCVGS